MNQYYGFIYKTVLPDGRYYIGQHKIINANTLDPKYFGSGVIIKDYIKSKGTSGLTRAILEFGSSHDDLNILEAKFVTDEVLRDPMCINLDTGGRHLDSRSPSVRQRIGETISKRRKANPELWKSLKGSKNNRSVNWKLISPNGDEYIICGGLNDFCDSFGISAVTIKTAVREGWLPKRGKCAGWQAFNLDNNTGTVRDTLNHGESHSGKNNPHYKHKR